MKRRRYFSAGGVPTTGGDYSSSAQYPFPASSGGGGAPASTTNTTVNVNGQEVSAEQEINPFGLVTQQIDEGAPGMRRGGKVKAKPKRARGDGIAERGRTRGRFVR
jgi:hypothetical protein